MKGAVWGWGVHIAGLNVSNGLQIPSKIGSLFHNLGDKFSYRSFHAVDALFTEPDGMRRSTCV